MKALMISRDAGLHDEIAAQGAARMPVLRLLERRSGLRDAVERMLPEPPELVIVDASGIDAGWLLPSEARRLENLPTVEGIDHARQAADASPAATV